MNASAIFATSASSFLTLRPELQQTSAFTLSAPTILVAEDLTPSQFLSLDTQYLKGMVLEKQAGRRIR